MRLALRFAVTASADRAQLSTAPKHIRRESWSRPGAIEAQARPRAGQCALVDGAPAVKP